VRQSVAFLPILPFLLSLLPYQVGHTIKQVAQLWQRDRAAGWVSFGWVVGDMAWVRKYSAPNLVAARKLKH